ncbi:hypothetical protein N7535_007439 [Penicillium sp. DV-2018c]|nr:hypothetical protein N7461_003467 [Penicillium sp. DV-2018c]KAJ5565801.1 hypothetical protein N7535_007439 [Penicillium sp. DV-2018c]
MQPDLKPHPLAYRMRYHRELFVDPLCWTSRHLDLVGGRFKELKSTDSEYTEDNTEPARSLSSSPSDAERLARSCATMSKHGKVV